MDLIIGIGNIGRVAAYLFASRGSSLRLGARSIAKAQMLTPALDAEFCQFDFDLPDSFKSALDGVDTVFFIAPQSHPTPSVKAFLAEAKAAGVKKLIFSSGRTTGDVPGKPLYKVEEIVRNQSIPFTILRPGWFMQNFTGWIGATIANEGAFYLPIGKERTAFIDCRDIADVAWHVARSDEWNGQTLPLTSEQGLDHDQVAAELSRHSGRDIQFVSLTADAYCDKMTSLGWTRSAAMHVVDLYKVVSTGKEEEVSPWVRQVLKRAPYTLELYLRHHPHRVADLIGSIKNV